MYTVVPVCIFSGYGIWLLGRVTEKQRLRTRIPGIRDPASFCARHADCTFHRRFKIFSQIEHRSVYIAQCVAYTHSRSSRWMLFYAFTRYSFTDSVLFFESPDTQLRIYFGDVYLFHRQHTQSAAPSSCAVPRTTDGSRHTDVRHAHKQQTLMQA